MTQEKTKRLTGGLFARLGVAVLALAATAGIAACGDSASGSGTVNLVAYSTPQQAYEDSLS